MYCIAHSTRWAHFRNYSNGGIELSETMESFESIDEAFHWFSSRTEIVTLGKVMKLVAVLTEVRQRAASVTLGSHNA
jgi:hypothetical protein